MFELMFNFADELNIKLSDEQVELKIIQSIATRVDELIVDQIASEKCFLHKK